MEWKTLVSVAELQAALGEPQLRLIDCRFDLREPEAGRQAYQAAHLPGALYADLDRDLSSHATESSGRHPLPSLETMTATFGQWGITPQTQVVAYDDRGGLMASRLWWMLRLVGHDRVAVLDGGWQAWHDGSGPVTQEVPSVAPIEFESEPRLEFAAEIDDVPAAACLVDARGATRYAGLEEPMDPVAGHIPGALNRPYTDNLNEAGQFRPPAELRREFESLLGSATTEDTIFYCGSGVSACMNLLAMAHAGMPVPRLYVGSWSQWCRLRPDQVAVSDAAD